MQIKVNLIPVLLILQLCVGNIAAQEYKINQYGINEGITQSFVYTINQDSRGYIWIGTGEGLCRFNGFIFNASNAQDSLAGQVAGVSYKDTRGSLWFGYYNGDIVKYDGKKFDVIVTGIEINSAITGFAEFAGVHAQQRNTDS
jgi:ligand-binding sensor domain-containing protein